MRVGTEVDSVEGGRVTVSRTGRGERTGKLRQGVLPMYRKDGVK